MRISPFERFANYAILIIVALVVLTPVATILVTAFGPASASDARVSMWHPENFQAAWVEGRFGQYMATSVLVAVIVVTLTVVLSSLSGYAFGTMRFPGSTPLFYLFLLGIMVPAEVIVVPLFYDLRDIGLVDTIWAVALPQVAQSVAFGTYWMRTYFRGVNRSMIEAAKLDGASSRRILWSVLLPMGRPALTTMTVLVFMWTWNEFLIPLIMSPSGQFRTAPLGLAFFQGQYTQGTALLAAGAILVALPVVLLYIFLQRHFIKGMLEGAVKE
ncbi:carbohydrate ABC transporter permease [Paramicrobacterium agarici]|uniref:Carbohydrate ABC transporter membrane protein 2 (CUT1 family) n=1 Tax=Paramicrobacterium agarici TaxID=630514 RepID=A0A2A9DTP8_9MICO|nr:carbohydrate ABC transporter permease [Microbacterium agarici]PFG29736.1 carbohydrate ABC transporter membrane protein 2 (CUT1 family) [Microbacterium agarici]